MNENQPEVEGVAPLGCFVSSTKIRRALHNRAELCWARPGVVAAEPQ